MYRRALELRPNTALYLGNLVEASIELDEFATADSLLKAVGGVRTGSTAESLLPCPLRRRAWRFCSLLRDRRLRREEVPELPVQTRRTST